MKAEDIYPNLAVWVRSQSNVWKGIVVKKIEYVHITNQITEWGFEVREENNNSDDSWQNYFCYYYELEPRDPNNLDEVPPLPLNNSMVIVDELGIPIGQFGEW